MSTRYLSLSPALRSRHSRWTCEDARPPRAIACASGTGEASRLRPAKTDAESDIGWSRLHFRDPPAQGAEAALSLFGARRRRPVVHLVDLVCAWAALRRLTLSTPCRPDTTPTLQTPQSRRRRAQLLLRRRWVSTPVMAEDWAHRMTYAAHPARR